VALASSVVVLRQSREVAPVDTAEATPAESPTFDGGEETQPRSEGTPVDTPDVHAPAVPAKPTPRPRAPRQTRTVASTQAPPTLVVASAEREYQRAIEVLTPEVERTRLGLTPEVRESVDKTIASLDKNIAGTRTAAFENPKDPIAAQYMMAAYQQKVDALQDIASLSSRFDK